MSLKTAFEQTEYIIEYIKHNSTQWLRSFNECALSYMTSTLSRQKSIESLVAPELLILLNSDKEKGTEYYKTLRTYLRNERSIPRTSEELIIHRTTLQYRLEKITELTKLNLDKEKQRLYLLMSFIMLDGED